MNKLVITYPSTFFLETLDDIEMLVCVAIYLPEVMSTAWGYYTEPEEVIESGLFVTAEHLINVQNSCQCQLDFQYFEFN